MGTFQTGTVQGVKKLLNINILCLSGQVTGYALAWDLVRTFLNSHFKGDVRFTRHLAKVASLEKEIKPL